MRIRPAHRQRHARARRQPAAPLATERLGEAVAAWLSHRSVTGYGGERPVAVPTMVIQGSTDTLMPLRQGLGLIKHVWANGEYRDHSYRISMP